MKVVLATGIYPPAIGGPARYVFELQKHMQEAGHTPIVVTYRAERFLPVGIRHLVYAIRLFFATRRADGLIVFDTFSVGLPASIVRHIRAIPMVVRIGGDILWERYTEHTLIGYEAFYRTLPKLRLIEKIFYKAFRFLLHSSDVCAFTSVWQRDIVARAYGIPKDRLAVVENHFGAKKRSKTPKEKVFLFSVRNVGFKNRARTLVAFEKAQAKHPEISIDTGTYPFDALQERIASCYAVLLPSIADINPNFIIEAISHNKPFIMTRESGLFDTVKDIGIFVDPTDTDAISNAITSLLDDANYNRAVKKIEAFDKEHSWEAIWNEYHSLLQSVGERIREKK